MGIDSSADDAGEAARAPAASAASPAAIGVGSLLRQRYELRAVLGQGGMGTVYRALDRYRDSLGLEDSQVALKIVSSPHTRSASITAFGREFHNTQRLSHPNVINVYDIDHEGEASFYTMELLDGLRLSQLLQRLGTLPRRYALTILRDIGSAIAHAHSRGIVHADLKPHNIMITRDGELRVMDFGSVSVMPREPWICAPSADDDVRQATPAYASCEQLEGWSPEPHDDIYALACIAYLLFTGRHPFDHQSALEARSQHLRARRPSAMPARCWRALRRGLAFRREQRRVNIHRWLRQLGVDAAAPALPPLSQLTVASPPRPWRPRLAAAALILAAVALAAFALQRLRAGDWRRAPGAADHAPDAASQHPQSGVQPNPSTPPATSPAALSPAASPQQGAAIEPGLASVSPVAFAAATFSVAGGQPAARIVIQRRGNSSGELSFVWWTEQASAKPDVDYASLGRRTEHIRSGEDRITVFVPIISNPLRTAATQFYVALGRPGGSGAAPAIARARVTIDRGVL